MPNSTKISKPTVGALFNVLDTKAKAERKKSQEIESKREARLRKERRQQYARDPEELKASLASSSNSDNLLVVIRIIGLFLVSKLMKTCSNFVLIVTCASHIDLLPAKIRN